MAKKKVTVTQRMKKERDAARYKARKYRDRWLDAHVADVENVENLSPEATERYLDDCRYTHRLPWEKL